ncbi:unnamed protein product, partial [Didymodactylos carnosus]
ASLFPRPSGLQARRRPVDPGRLRRPSRQGPVRRRLRQGPDLQDGPDQHAQVPRPAAGAHPEGRDRPRLHHQPSPRS